VNRKTIKPAALKSGDTVAVVAPAAAIEREHLERGVNLLASMGFRSRYPSERWHAPESWPATIATRSRTSGMLRRS